MSHTDPAPARKTSRVGLYGPFVLAGIVIIVWSAGWLWARGEAERRVDQAAARWRAAGGELSWARRDVHGYPFRLDVDFTDLRVSDPSGWGLATPTLKTEMAVFAGDRLMIVVPNGASVTRPRSGTVRITARVLRASLAGWDRQPPRISIEGMDLTFAPFPGAKPLPITEAREFQFHTRAGPNDQGEFALQLIQAKARPDDLLGRISDGGRIDLDADMVFSHASRVRGGGWPAAVRAWSQAGGALTVQRVRAQAAGAVFESRAGTLGVQPDGHVAGSLTATLSQAAASPPPANAPAPQPRGPRVTLAFTAGKMSLDGVVLDSAPRVF